MSRTVFAAILAPIALCVTLATSGPTLAGDRAAPSAQTPDAATPPPAAPASAAERAAYDRADALSRSVFWAQQQEIDPTDPVAGVKLVQALRELGQNDQAAAVAQQIFLTQPNNIEAMLEVGRVHIGRGQAFYGIAALEQAHTLAPNDWRPLSLLGVAYSQVRRTEEGRNAWAEGLRLSPENPEILTNEAMSLLAQSDAAAAEGLLRRAVAQPGATIKMRLNLALALGIQGKMPEAEQIIRRDLPPEVADRNLLWLRNKTTPGAQTASTQMGDSPSTARTWNSLQGQ